MRVFDRRVWLFFVCAMVPVSSAWCGESAWLEATKLTASDGAATDDFGGSVSVSGDVALVGADDDDDDGSGSGSTYVFRYDGTEWVEEQKLTASDAAAGDDFGRSVSLSGDVALVAAYQNDDDGLDSGSAYVFRYDGTEWVEEQKLTASDGAAGDEFGYSISLSGDVALVAALGQDDNGTDSGAVYVFRYDGTEWVEEQKLTASDGAAGDDFGGSVSVSGDVALAGADDDDDDGSGSGSAYVFRYDGRSWVEEQKLTASDGAAGDDFGVSVSLSGDVALVAAYEDDDNGLDSGSAYVFRYDGTEWVEEQKLTASDGAAEDEFGGSVSVSGDVVLVAALADDDNGLDSGSAYVFRYDGTEWVEEQKLTASDGAAEDEFGYSVSVSGDVAFVAALGDDDNGSDSGSVYVFDAIPPDCNGNGIADAVDIELGDSQDCNLNAVPDECDASGLIAGAKITAADVTGGALFGSAIAVDGGVMAVGARTDSEAATNGGAVYVFRWNGVEWVQEQKLIASDAGGFDEFGYAVDIDGDVIAVGARHDDDAASNAGSAYVFRRVGGVWTEEDKLFAPGTPSVGEEFGYSVAVSGDAVAVGAWLDDEGAANSGSVFVFRYDGEEWGLEDTLNLASPMASDQFGRAVALSGDWLVAGAANDDDAAGNAGSVSFYEWDGRDWVGQKLTASDAAEGDALGISVAIDGGLAAVGAWWEDTNGSNSGAAYVFRLVGSTWAEEDKLTAADGAMDDHFGNAVAVSRDLVAVGAHHDETSAGSLYAFTCGGDGWDFAGKLGARSPATDDELGISVAASGTMILGGAHGDDLGSDPAEAGAGSVSLFLFADCNGNGSPDFCDIEGGLAADVDKNGIIDDCESGPLLCGGHEPPPVVPLFKRGDADGNGTVSGLADGLFLLRWQFTAGPAPACLDAADADGNNTATGLNDGLRLLRWQFTSGLAPPDPGTVDCGTDPDDGVDTGCETPPPSCDP